MSEDVQVFRRNFWTITSFILGLLGFLVALTAPIPLIPILSAFTWPLGLGAMVTGWVGERLAKTAGDAGAIAQARWGIRLGCLGWLFQFIVSTIKVLILAGILALFVNNMFNPQPTTTP